MFLCCFAQYFKYEIKYNDFYNKTIENKSQNEGGKE